MGGRRGKRKRASDCTLQHCIPCNVLVPPNQVSQDEHFGGKGHKRLEDLYLYRGWLTKHGLGWMKGRKEFKCVTCIPIFEHMPADIKLLEAHVLKYHGGYSFRKIDGCMVGPTIYKGPLLLDIIPAVHLSRPKVFWTNEYTLDSMAPTFVKLTPPLSIVERENPSISLLIVVNAKFQKEELNFLTTEVETLESKGNPTKRGELKAGTRMVSFGVRFAYGKLGWYIHENFECYRRSEILATVISDHLRKLFPTIFLHLDQIREMEELEPGVGCIGNTPFTGMSITRDYNCNIHIDKDDYSYGFFVWLGQNGMMDSQGNGVKFYLPGFYPGYFLEPSIGDVMLFKAKDVLHCTKSFGTPGQFGVALYQKASFFRWHDAVLERIRNNDLDDLVTSWADSNKMYQSHCS